MPSSPPYLQTPDGPIPFVSAEHALRVACPACGHRTQVHNGRLAMHGPPTMPGVNCAAGGAEVFAAALEGTQVSATGNLWGALSDAEKAALPAGTTAYEARLSLRLTLAEFEGSRLRCWVDAEGHPNAAPSPWAVIEPPAGASVTSEPG